MIVSPLPNLAAAPAGSRGPRNLCGDPPTLAAVTYRGMQKADRAYGFGKRSTPSWHFHPVGAPRPPEWWASGLLESGPASLSSLQRSGS